MVSGCARWLDAGGLPEARSLRHAYLHPGLPPHFAPRSHPTPTLQVIADLTPDSARVLWASKSLEVGEGGRGWSGPLTWPAPALPLLARLALLLLCCCRRSRCRRRGSCRGSCRQH